MQGQRDRLYVELRLDNDNDLRRGEGRSGWMAMYCTLFRISHPTKYTKIAGFPHRSTRDRLCHYMVKCHSSKLIGAEQYQSIDA